MNFWAYKTFFILILIGTAMIGATAQAAKKKVIFFGDSITEQGVKPDGYISLLQLDKDIADRFEVSGAGVGGNKVYDLYLRMDADVMSKQPDVVVIYIGINDVWHKRLLGTGTDYDKFSKFYEAIIKKLRDAGIVPIVCTPTLIGERLNQTNEMDGELNLYSEYIRSFGKKNDIAVVDLRKIFVETSAAKNIENKDQGILTVDKVHLNKAGNVLVASEMKRALIALKP